MHKNIFHLTLISLLVIFSAAFATLWVVSNERIFLVIAFWFAVPVCVLLFFLIFHSYQRVMRGLRRTDERVKEVQHLNERRYELLARRLDSLSHQLGSGPQDALSPNSPEVISSKHDSWHRRGDLEQMESRLERIERRILGSLENVLWQQDLHQRTIEGELRDFLENEKFQEVPRSDSA